MSGRKIIVKNVKKRSKRFIPTSQLILLAFATAFFPRIFDLLGAPSAINFLHFVTVPLACGFAIFECRSKNKKQIAIIQSLILGLFILFGVILASAFLNKAGFINLLIDFMLLGEPFLLLTSIVSLSLSPETLTKFKKWLLSFFFAHLFSVYVQKYILRVDTWEWLGMVANDRIQGVFLLSGAGHVVGASVSMSFSFYFFMFSEKSPLWLRIGIILASFWNLLIADAKQVLFVFMFAGVLLFFTKLKNPLDTIKYLVSGIVLWLFFIWCLENLELFRAFNTWLEPELYGRDGEATLLKMATFRIVPTHYNSILNWFLGLGPGHTVGRLGGWMFENYSDLLLPLGATQHIASREVWRAVSETFIGSRSSMFSPLFGWAGIWGDLGLLGLVAYINLGFLVWSNICKDSISKFLVLTVLVFGLIFSQLEEPGYMLSISAIIGLRYQENLIWKKGKQIT